MYRFLFVSEAGLIGDIAWQILKEGHDVRYFVGDPAARDIADGFVPKVDDWAEVIPSMYYRDDIGERWADDSDRLQAWGWLRD